MVIQNGLVFGEDCLFSTADLAFEAGKITRIAPAGSLSAPDAIDACGGFVLPGFVDIHIHGCGGADVNDAEADGIRTMLQACGRSGVTSIVAAAMSHSEARLARIIKAARPLVGQNGHGAVLRGLYLEGPFLNPEKKGAHSEAALSEPDIEMFERLMTQAGGCLRFLGLAPELPGAMQLIRRAAGRCVVSLAHTMADYDTAVKAFQAGATHVTHLFNAMTPFSHRAPGIFGAACDDAAVVELIADGVHLHPAVVRLAFRCFGPRRVCLVSDSVRQAGLPDGLHEAEGRAVQVAAGRIADANSGTLLGGAADLAECCRRAVQFGVPMEQAVRAATLNPAKAAGVEHTVGSLMPGKRADIVVWTRDLQLSEVIAGGVRLLN